MSGVGKAPAGAMPQTSGAPYALVAQPGDRLAQHVVGHLLVAGAQAGLDVDDQQRHLGVGVVLDRRDAGRGACG